MKSKNSKVTINNLDIEILSRSDKKIEVNLPRGITSGPVVVYNGEKFTYRSNDNVYFNLKQVCQGAYEVYSSEVPSFDTFNCKWATSKQVITLCLILKDGKVNSRSPTCYNSPQEVSGSYDNNGNITFTFTWKNQMTTDMYGFIVTGTFTGKFVKNCHISGTISGKARAYWKNPTFCKPYDLTMDFTALMFSKGYKP